MRRQVSEPYPEAWIATDTEAEFVGTFRQLKKVSGQFGDTWVAVFEEHTTGTLRSVWLNHAVLRNEIALVAPKPGELVVIRYHGRVHPEGGGQPYALYRVAVDRPDGPGIDWADISPEVRNPRPAGDPETSEFAAARRRGRHPLLTGGPNVKILAIAAAAAALTVAAPAGASSTDACAQAGSAAEHVPGADVGGAGNLRRDHGGPLLDGDVPARLHPGQPDDPHDRGNRQARQDRCARLGREGRLHPHRRVSLDDPVGGRQGDAPHGVAVDGGDHDHAAAPGTAGRARAARQADRDPRPRAAREREGAASPARRAPRRGARPRRRRRAARATRRPACASKTGCSRRRSARSASS